MKWPFPVLAFFYAIGGCSALSVSNSTSAQEVQPPLKDSKYQQGDYILYKYSGSYRKHPILLRETILRKHQNQLAILVEWRSGDERRSWKQVVTDTAENRKINKVDQLYEITRAGEKLLPNTNNHDLYRLYEGTYLQPVEADSRVVEEIRRHYVCGHFVNARFKNRRVKVLGSWANLVTLDSDDFIWTHIEARYVSETDGRILYKAEVLQCGNESDHPDIPKITESKKSDPGSP